MFKKEVECELCESILNGGEAYVYDGCFWCSIECIKEHLYEMERQEISEVYV